MAKAVDMRAITKVRLGSGRVHFKVRVCYRDPFGARHEFKATEHDYATAIRTRNLFEADAEQRRIGTLAPGSSPTFEKAAEVFIEECLFVADYDLATGQKRGRGYAPRVVPQLKKHVADATAHFGTRRIDKITSEDLFAYRQARLRTKIATKTGERKRSLTTVNREIATLSILFTWCVRRRLITSSPFAGERLDLVPTGRESRRQTIVSVEQERKLLAVAPEHLARLIAFLIDTGCRRGEAFSLLWSDVDLASKVITIRAANTKTRKARLIPITARLLTLLRSLPRLEHGYVFTGPEGSPLHEVKRSWATATRRAGLEGLRLHDLRHSFAARMATGASLSDVGSLMGHSTPIMTQRYAGQDPSRLARLSQILDDIQDEVTN